MSTPGPQGRPWVRLVLIPAVLFAAFSGTVFALAQLHLAKPDAPAAVGRVVLGDSARGELVFAEKCAGCHGQGGRGGETGPRLAGSGLSLAAAKAQVDNGSGVMPAGLVSGRREDDLLAYLDTILDR